MSSRIAIVASDLCQRVRLAGNFQGLGYEVSTASRLGDVDPVPDALLTLAEDDPRRTARRLDAAFSDARHVVRVAVLPPDPAARLTALRAGFDDVLQTGQVAGFARARLRGLLRDAEAAREADRRADTAQSFGFGLADARTPFAGVERVDILGDLPEEIEAALARPAGRILRRTGVATALAGREAADAYVLGAALDAPGVLAELRARGHSRHAAILAICDDDDRAVRALDARASDVAPFDALPEEIALRLDRALARKTADDRLRAQAEASFEAALTDPLTGLWNRLYARRYLSETLSRARRTGESFCVMMIDIDNFKSVNDSQGHPFGDRLIRHVANALRDNLRAVDLVARLGGDEFLVVMPGTRMTEASQAAERLRAAVARLSLPVQGGAAVGATLSIGATVETSLAFEGRDPGAMIATADRALYAAKHAGRNCVRIAGA